MMERLQQLLGATLVAYLIYPLFVPLQERAITDVKAWGLKGPGLGLPIPCMGVYAFKGLSPVVTVDMSYAYDYDADSKSFWLDFTPDSVTVAAEATPATFSSLAKYQDSSPTPSFLPGWYVLKQFSVLRYRVKFTFESDNVAVLQTCIGGCWSPLSFLFNKALAQTLEKGKGGAWLRQDYASFENRTRLSGYELLPVLLPGGKVNSNGLRYAKGKLEAAGATLKGGVMQP